MYALWKETYFPNLFLQGIIELKLKTQEIVPLKCFAQCAAQIKGALETLRIAAIFEGICQERGLYSIGKV